MPKSTIHYLRGMVWVGGGNVLGIATGLATIMLAVRMVSKQEMGAYFLVMIVVQFGAILGDIGLRNTAIKNLSAGSHGDEHQTARFLATVTLIVSIGITAAMALALPLLTQLWPYPEFRKYAWFCVPLSFLTINFQMMSALIAGTSNYKSLSVLNGSTELVKAVVSIAALFSGWGTGGLLWGMILSRVFGIGVTWRLVPSYFGITLQHPTGMELIRFGGWLYGCSLISLVTVKASDTILTTYVGTAALAIYSAAMQLPSALLRVFESIRPILLGYVSSRAIADSDRQIESIRIGAGFLAAFATVLIGIAAPLTMLLFSQEYGEGVKIMQALCVWTAISIVNYYFSITLIGNGSPRKAFLLAIPQVIISITATGILVPLFQGLGAAFALIVTSLLGNVLGAWVVAGNNFSRFISLNSAHLRAALPLLALLSAVCFITYSPLLMLVLVLATLAGLLLVKSVTMEDGRRILEALTGCLPTPAPRFNS